MRSIYASLLPITLLVTANQLLAQNNYVANVANNNSPGISNTLVGAEAGNLGMSGGYNVYLGYQAGFKDISSGQNVSVGARAGYSNTYGGFNTFIGGSTGYKNITGSENIFQGFFAGYNNTSGGQNVYIGNNSGYSASTGSQNTFVGYYSGFNNQAAANTFIGYQAGKSNNSGTFNTFIGVNAGLGNVEGNSNFMMGTNAGIRNTGGSANFFLGDNAGSNNKTGSYNVFLGTNAGASNDYGFNNTAIGFEANVVSGELVNATALGYRALVTRSNSLVLGSGANVGIGTSAPTAKLEVVSSSTGTSGLKLTSLPISTSASAVSQTKFLTVDGAGNVILGSINASANGRQAALSELWQQKGSYLQSSDDKAVIIGQGISKTPTDYNLFVSKGILTEKVKVAVKNASEWSDYVFAPTYYLTPLAEVARFIQTNKHLPGVPSAAEVVEQGVDVAKMDAKLLEKIEELTLYSIQLEQKLQAVNQQQAEQIQAINQRHSQAMQQQQAELDELKQLVRQLLNRK